MKKIKLTKGKFALVDDEDYGKLSKYKWHANHDNKGKFYADRSTFKGIKGEFERKMHRLIMDCPKGKEIDHIDGNGLNNQKSNLRVCTHAQNMKNMIAHKDSRSGLRGVSPSGKKWQVRITNNYKEKYIGTYNSKLEAYQAYCDACTKYHGDYNNSKRTV